MKCSGLLAAWLLLALAPLQAEALPMYALGSGRTCGNCHISPTYQDRDGWKNPELAERKCNLSCIACHVSPGGGGLRNTSGRYYGQSSVSMLALQERSYSDYGRDVAPAGVLAYYRENFGTPSPDPRGHDIPSNFEAVDEDRRGGALNFGKPLLGPSEYALWDGRYGDLNADPLLALGLDLRGAYWTGSESFFPMQLDLHAQLHPIEHLSLVGTLAARGRVAGPSAVLAQASPVYPRNAYVMLHELPYAAALRAGIFVPTFGTYLDDHTSYIRRWFDLDLAKSESSVLGVELSVAPNYPYASISAFRNLTPVGAQANTDGYGAAVALGWRDLSFSAGAHGMLKRGEVTADLDAIGLSWGLSPFALWESVPLVTMGELSFGRRADPIVGGERTFFALYQEVWWLVGNGLDLRFKYDLGSQDLAATDALEQRLSLGLGVSPVPGLSLLIQGRTLVPAPGVEGGSDLFTTLHLWL